LNEPARIRFEDGAAYEENMGKWSRLAGETFLDWLAPPKGLRWIDVGCGNGAFTELLVERTAPTAIEGIDPSEAQLAYARTRHKAGIAHFRGGDATALPFPDDSFDAAVMALVLFFVPDPVKGVAEMIRVVRPGGIVAVYLWDLPAGGIPHAPVGAELRAMGLNPALPPSFQISNMEALRALWQDSKFEEIDEREIVVTREFADFDALWKTFMLAPTLAPVVAGMTPADVEALKTRVRARFPADQAGRVTCRGRANAIKGRVPAK
jgi:ubiquinone/menaquinone biosynthesis C-methylase UbiE